MSRVLDTLRTTNAVSIDKIRLRSNHGDPLLLRLRLDRVLSSMDLTPRGLPATTIVYIRRLLDPRPGLLDLSANTLHSIFEWEQALRDYIAALVARAPRLSAGIDAPPDAECVIFLDQADLFAAVAHDWCRGETVSRWWWRALFKSTRIERRELLTMWRDAAEHVPAALERLGPRKIDFVGKLSDVEADELFEAVVRRFSLDFVDKEEVFTPSIKLVEPHAPATAKAPAAAKAAPPWRRFVTEIRTIQKLRVAQERFLGVSLMLLRAPSTVRTRKFATEIAVWQQEKTDAFNAPDLQPKLTAVPAPIHDRVSFRSVLNPNTPLPTERANQSVKSVLRGSEPDVFFENSRIESVTSVERGETEVVSAIAEEREKREEIEVSVGAEVVQRARAIEVIPEVETNFAGVFYLVNLGIYLGLYGDFTMPMEPGIELNIWDFVALAGRELIGDEIEKDPVWLLLADLAGREDDLENMQTWLDELMPSVRQRLRAALGLDETIDPGPLLIAYTGRVRVTDTHIDVFLLLAELPIAIRFAGLDRDPGWVPAAGRFIAFHFN